MELTLKTEAVRYIQIEGREFRFTRVLQQLIDLSRDGRLLDLSVTEPEFFRLLEKKRLVERRWFGRETGHGYAVRNPDAFDAFYKNMQALKKTSDTRPDRL